MLSSFGDITLGIDSIIGKNVKLTLSSVYSGTTKSKVNSINNLKLELIGETVLKDLTCEINTNIDFSSKDGILCELGEESDGNPISIERGRAQNYYSRLLERCLR